MKKLIYILFLFLCFVVNAQVSEQLIAMNNSIDVYEIKSSKKLLSNSESSEYSFIINSNVKENMLYINTNYSGKYKVRFIGYYGGSRKVYKNNYSDKVIDISEFGKEIFIMNITDSRNNKLLSSQVINLKRRHL